MRRFSFFLIGVCMSVGQISAQYPSDALGEGLINGIQGVSFWPADTIESGPRDFAGCFAHLRSRSEPRTEVVLTCGEWHLPPRCDEFFIGWLEQGFEISSQIGVKTGVCQPGAAKRGAKLLVPMGPAGIVALDSQKILKKNESFRTISSSGFVRRTFEPTQANPEHLFPVGEAISVIHRSDPEGDEYVSATQPFTLRAGKTESVSPEVPPEDLGFLIVKLRGDPGLISETSADVVDTLGKRHLPDFSASTRGWTVLMFYDLPAGPVTTLVRGAAWAPPVSTSIAGGKIRDEEIQIRPLPNLEITYAVPKDLCREITLGLSSAVSGESIQTRTTDSDVGSEQFEAVPATQLIAELRCDLRRVTGLVDLSDGGDAFVHLEPKAFTIEGTLFVDDEPGAGMIEFAGNGDWIRTSASESGEYSCVLFHPVEMIRARAEETSDWRLFGISPLPISEDEVKDLFLPAGSVSVEVLNSSTSEPIPNAKIGYLMEDDGEEPGARQGGRGLVTDVDGMVFLPPMFAGELELSVKAPGFKDGNFSFQTLGDGKDWFVVHLDPEETKATIELLLSSGAPASGAKVLLTYPGYNAQRWVVTALFDGRARLPDVPASIIFIFHPESGLFGQSFRFPEENDEAQIVLPHRAPPALVRFISNKGEAVPGARYNLSVNGLAANFIIQNELVRGQFPMVADDGGLVRIDGVSSARPGILGWDSMDRLATEDALRGAYDGSFSDLTPDHTGIVEVEIVSSSH